MVEEALRKIPLGALLLALAACGPGGHAGDAASGSAAALSSPPPAAASASAARPAGESPAPAASAAAPPPASAAAADAASAPPEPAVIELRAPASRKKLQVAASGKVTMERSFEALPEQIGFGQVPLERVEELHKVLRDVGFCGLAPKQRESAPGYIIIEARFSDVACSVELPDARWDKDPKPRKVMEVMRKLESEACPRGCKP